MDEITMTKEEFLESCTNMYKAGYKQAIALLNMANIDEIKPQDFEKSLEELSKKGR